METVAGIYWGYDGSPKIGTPPRLYNQIAILVAKDHNLFKKPVELSHLLVAVNEGRMRLLAMVTEPKSVARYLRALGEPTEAPARTAARGPPYWQSRILRRGALGNEAAEQSRA